MNYLNEGMPLYQWIFDRSADGGLYYSTLPAVLMTLLGVALLVWFWKLPIWEEGSGGEGFRLQEPLDLTKIVQRQSAAK